MDTHPADLTQVVANKIGRDFLALAEAHAEIDRLRTEIEARDVELTKLRGDAVAVPAA
jgi:hypothetical protein